MECFFQNKVLNKSTHGDTCIICKKYSKVLFDEQKENLRIYDAGSAEEVVKYLFENNIIVNELKTDKIGLEEYYINLMKIKEVK